MNIFTLTTVWFFVVTGLLNFFIGGSAWDSISHVAAIVLAGLFYKKFSKIGLRFSVPFVVVFVTYVLCLLMATIVAADSSKLIVATKYYLYFLPICIVVTGLSCHQEFLSKLCYAWEKVFILQIPFLLFQYFVVLPQSGNWDVMTGTFGGSQEFGGNSGGMAIFLLAYAALCLSEMANRLGSFWISARDLLGIFLIAALAEVKVVLLLAPFVAFLSLVKLDGKSIVFSIIFVFTSLALGDLVLGVYAREYYGIQGGTLEVISYVAEEFLDPDYILLEWGDLGRVTALNVWWEMNESEMFSFLFGHGIMSIKEGASLSMQSISTAYQYKLGGSSLVFILWDFGFVGCGAFVLALLYGATRSFTFPLQGSSPEVQSMQRFAGILLLVIVITLPYSNSLIDTAQTKWLLVCAIAIAFRVNANKKLVYCSTGRWCLQ